MTGQQNGTIKKRRQPKQNAKSRLFELIQAGTHALQSGRPSKAIELLEAALKLDKTHPDTILNLAGAYILTKKFKQAVNILEPLSKREPDNPMVWTNLGAAYLGNPVLAKDENQRQAIAAFEKALALNPITPNVAYNIGLIYIDRKDNDQALRWFKRAVQANPKDRDARNYIKKLESDTGAEEAS